jgi:shikimate kinase
MRLTDSAFNPPSKDRWFIWGMPLSGKTSLGKKLKKIVPFPVLDLDKELEKRYGKTVTEIFGTEGESSFRKKETELLEQIIKENTRFVVIAGGGTPCYENNGQLMLSTGNCIFMHTAMDEILKRSQEMNADRPLLANNPQERLLELYEKRLPVYQKAHAEFFSEKEGLDYFQRVT